MKVEEVKYTTSELVNIGREVVAHEPQIVEKYRYRVQRPDPEIYHIIYLYPLRIYFCESLHISLKELVHSTTLRKKFITVAIKLFNPEYISGYTNEVKDNLAEQISELLQCDRSWVSQHVSYSRDILNPKNDRIASSYEHERKEAEEIAPLLFKRIVDEISVIKRKPEAEVTDMFKNQAS